MNRCRRSSTASVSTASSNSWPALGRVSASPGWRRRPVPSGATGDNSPPVADGADDLGGEFRIAQQLVNERREDLLSGDPGEPQPVGRVSLPDVEGTVLGGREVDRSAGSGDACSSENDGFGGCRCNRWCQWGGARRDRSASDFMRSTVLIMA
ncbi:hypothetical protein I553_1396 [Mycobacterium xenopi 4042]|uniref:Uncharacterized protein n=1 Tax=Mycobacterium xenopi 4042 TaxID=1299334 RepID=X8CGS8_MYCXE|nr:hypothetical protein I553_1396 [Mycobacterium xenopi 4042]